MKETNTLKANNKYLYTLISIGGVCSKKDFMIYLTHSHINYETSSAKNAAGNNLKILAKNGWVEIIPKQEHNTEYDYIRVTDKGYVRVADKLDAKVSDLTERFPRSTSYTKKNIEEALNKARILIAMKTCGVMCTPDEKPCFEHLMGYDLDTPREPYLAYTPELGNYLLRGDGGSDGLFYTSSEIRGIEKHIKNDSHFNDLDVTLSTKFAGVFMNTKRITVIFTQDIGDQTMMSVGWKSMKTLLKIIEDEIFTRIKQSNINSKTTFSNYESEALILANSRQAIYTAVTGNVDGHAKPGAEKDGIETKREAKEAYIKSRKEKDDNNVDISRQSLIANTTEGRLFKRLYMLPMSAHGIDGMMYLFSQSEEDNKNNFLNVVSGSLNFTKNTVPTLKDEYPIWDDDFLLTVAVFMPVPELNLLRKMYEEMHMLKPKCYFSIITFEYLIECYARCVRNEKAHYYKLTVPDGEERAIPVLVPDVLNFTMTGFEAGKEKLLVHLHKQKLHYTKAELAKLPKIFNLSKNEFWDKVAKGEISLEQVTSTIVPTTKATRTISKKAIAAELDPTEYRRIKRYCSIKGITLRKFATDVIKEKLRMLSIDKE